MDKALRERLLKEGKARVSQDKWGNELVESDAPEAPVFGLGLLGVIGLWIMAGAFSEYLRLVGLELEDAPMFKAFNQYFLYSEFIYFPLHFLFDSINDDATPELNAKLALRSTVCLTLFNYFYALYWRYVKTIEPYIEGELRTARANGAGLLDLAKIVYRSISLEEELYELASTTVFFFLDIWFSAPIYYRIYLSLGAFSEAIQNNMILDAFALVIATHVVYSNDILGRYRLRRDLDHLMGLLPELLIPILLPLYLYPLLYIYLLSTFKLKIF